MPTFSEKLKIFNKRLNFLVKFLRYFVGKLQFLIKIKMQLNENFNNIIQQMPTEKKCLLLDQELQIFDLKFFISDLSIVIEDYKAYKQELLFFFIEYEDFLPRAIDVSVAKELNFFIKDLNYLLEYFESLNKIEEEGLLTEDLIKDFFSKFFNFYKSIKIYFWFVEKAAEDTLSEALMKTQNEKLNFVLSPWANEDDYDAERLDGAFPLWKGKAEVEEEDEYSDSAFIIAYGSFTNIDAEAEIAKDPLLIALTKKK
jgi:hypothetical protein